MANLKFEGEIQGLSERQFDFLKDVLGKRGYTDNEVVFEPVGQKGDNYVATVRRIVVKNENGNPFTIIAKVASSNEYFRTQMNQQGIFANEIFMYTEVLPKFQKLQEDAKLHDSEKYLIPECYGALSEEPYEIILLEDLRELGYNIFNRLKPLTNESIRLAIRNLAKFHSFSYLLKDKEPETFVGFTNKLLDMWKFFENIPDAVKYFCAQEEDILKLLQDDKHKNTLRNCVKEIMDMARQLRGETAVEHRVILQGDCWSSNIMYKVQDGKPVSAVFIDYQLCNDNSPASDLLYLILNCSDHETRSKYVKDWLEYYHRELDKSLVRFGLKVEKLYSKNQLDNDLKKFAKFGLAQHCMLVNIIAREIEDVVDFNDVEDLDVIAEKMSVMRLNDKTIGRIRKMITGSIDTLLELGYV